MYILTVIPLSKGIQKDELTYFSAKEIEVGSIVRVPMRSKTIDAIVINKEDASDRKSDLKNLHYELKKIESSKGKPPYKESFFKACEKMAEYSCATTGSVISALLPAILIEKFSELKHKNWKEGEEDQNRKSVKEERLIFQALLPDRISWYRTLIREAFAKKESVFICVPTRYDIDQFYEAFAKGIDQYVYKFHSELPKKSLVADFNKVVAEEHPILIIGTGPFLSIPRHDVRTIIVEHESSGAYKQIARPYIDIRTFAEVVAHEEHIKLIYGDTLLRPETLHRHDVGELGEVASPLFRLPTVERQMIIDMKEEIDAKGMHSFTVLSATTKKMITYALAHKETVFLFSLRKGLAGVTVCHDCGHTLLCEFCKTPVVLYGSKQKTADKEAKDRIFMCNKCGRKKTTETRCPICESWNLTPLGIGTDRVVEELKGEFPEANIVQVDKDSITTDKELFQTCNVFYKDPGTIMVGTELAFSCLREHVTHSAIISIDGLLSIPSFNINQKMLHIIEKLHSITDRNLIIQTRIPENTVLKHILSGTVLPMYREDLKEREEWGYPPFKRLIKITFRGTARETEKARLDLEKLFDGYEPQIFSAFVGQVKGQYVTNTVIKVDPKLWQLPTNPSYSPSPETLTLRAKIRSLSPAFMVNVDPEDLL
jgi:primosomal protein N' (replication factor Y)